ncbi:MAG: hypothetical protein ACREUE_14405 [Panacagrimonas sp.]
MLVSVGDITARCPKCQGTDFESASCGALRLTTELKCTGCGARHKYLVLLDQIGEEAMRRAENAIDALKKHPSRPPRKPTA